MVIAIAASCAEVWASVMFALSCANVCDGKDKHSRLSNNANENENFTDSSLVYRVGDLVTDLDTEMFNASGI